MIFSLWLIAAMQVCILWNIGRAVEQRWRVLDAQHRELLGAINDIKERQ